MGDPNEPRVRIRFPTLEIFALRSGGALAARTRRLFPAELDAGYFIFQNALDLSAVRVIASRYTKIPFTVGNNIRTRTGKLPLRVMVHELTHVWQYQTKGMGYVSDSVFHQAKAAIWAGGRESAYSSKLKPGKSIHSYTAEQQASIVEHFYASAAARKDPGYCAIIAEVRKTRPIPANVRRRIVLDEIVQGPGRNHNRDIPGPRSFRVRNTPGVSLFRLEF
ncbi:MAG: hypothetical protein AAF436_07700 [Myxococcota bacterium]